MENKARATVAGAFVVIMLSMVIAVVFWFSTDKKVLLPYDIVTVSSINGLAPQAIVQLRGIDVGRVDSVEFMKEMSGGVRIRMLIDAKAPVTAATYALLSYRGVTGTVYVELLDDLDSPEGNAQLLLYASDPSEPPQIPLRAGTLESFAGSMQNMLNQANTTLERLNAWLSTENERALFGAVSEVGLAASQIAHLGQTLEVKVGATLDQATQTLQQVNKMVVGLGAPGGVMASITEGTKALSSAARHLEGVTLPNIDQTVRTLDQTIRVGREALQGLQEQPQALIFGPNASRTTGPGEPGYQSPYSSGKNAQ